MNKFDKQIKSKLEGSKEVPPVGSWDFIQKGLEQKEPKHFLGYKKIASAAAIILLGLFLADRFMSPNNVFNGISKQDMPHVGDTKTSDATADKVKFNSSTEDKQSITISKDANPAFPNNSKVLIEDVDLDLNTTSKQQTIELVESDARGPADLHLNSKPSDLSIIGTSQPKKSVLHLGESGRKNQTVHSKLANNSFVKDGSLNADSKTNKFDNQLAVATETDSETKVAANKSANHQVSQDGSLLSENVPYGGNEDAGMNSQIADNKQKDNTLRQGLELVDRNNMDLSRRQEALSIPLSPKKTTFPIFPDNVYDDLLDHEALDDLLVEANGTEEQVSSKKRFDLYAYAAPTHFDIMNGVTMPEFEGVEQDFSNTMVYGVRAGYAINSRLKLRTGLSSLQVVARSNDLFFTSNLSSDNMTSPNVQAIENSSINYTSPMQINNNPASSVFSNEISALAINSFKGDVVQDISYVELPLELEYRFLNNKRFALSSVAGASTFFLTQNSVIVETIRENMELGEANNLNNTSYSANLGLKLDVNVLRNIDLSVEPHFKYLMNTVNNSPNFQPYLLGVNAGLSVSF